MDYSETIEKNERLKTIVKQVNELYFTAEVLRQEIATNRKAGTATEYNAIADIAGKLLPLTKRYK